MKKAVVVVLSMMILCVISAMGAILLMMEPATGVDPVPAEVQMEARGPVWQDQKGRCRAELLPGWQVLSQQETEGLFLHAKEKNAAVTAEQTALMRDWMHTGDATMFVSPDHKASIIICCRTMENELTDTYVTNLRNRYVQQVEKKYKHIDAGCQMDSTLAQTGNRISGVRCDNLHPSTWLLKMEKANSHVFFTYKGKNLYTIVISDAAQQNNAEVHSSLFDSLTLA